MCVCVCDRVSNSPLFHIFLQIFLPTHPNAHTHPQKVVECMFTLQQLASRLDASLAPRLVDMLPHLRATLCFASPPVRMQAALTLAEIASVPVWCVLRKEWMCDKKK